MRLHEAVAAIKAQWEDAGYGGDKDVNRFEVHAFIAGMAAGRIEHTDSTILDSIAELERDMG